MCGTPPWGAVGSVCLLCVGCGDTSSSGRELAPDAQVTEDAATSACQCSEGLCDGAGACVSCTADTCQDPGTLLACVSGTPTQVPCAADQTCFQGACLGECRYDELGCDPDQRAVRLCGLDGAWSRPIPCAGEIIGPSWQVCREGTCVDSDFIEQGHPDALEWDDIFKLALAGNRWRVGTVRPTKRMVLFQLNAFLDDVPNDGRAVRMAIWSDASDAGGRQPGELIAYTSTRAATPGLNRLDILDAPRPILEPGTVYWLGINISTAGSSLVARIGTGDSCTLAAPFTDVPYMTLNTFSDVSATIGQADYGIYVRGKEPL